MGWFSRFGWPAAAAGAAAVLWLASGCAPEAKPEANAAGSANPDPQANAAPAPPTAEAVELPRDPVRARVGAAIRQVQSREMRTSNGFWTVFHAVLGLGKELELTDDRPGAPPGARVRALDFMLDNLEMRGRDFQPTKHGLDVVTVSPARGQMHVWQGHQDQFLAEVVSEWEVPLSTPVRVHDVFGRTYTVEDFVKESMARVRIGKGQELSWAIVVVASHRGTDVKPWVNKFGETVSYHDMVREELDASITEAACGGTHRLFGLTWSYYRSRIPLLERRKTDPKAADDPLWAAVRAKLDKHQALAREYADKGDGTLSAAYFRGPKKPANPLEGLGPAGHTFEWLAQDLPPEELDDAWVEAAASSVSRMILDSANETVLPGDLYHAAHGLVTYYSRRWGDVPRPPVRTAAKR